MRIEPLVVTTRRAQTAVASADDPVENVHHGSIAVVSADGTLLRSVGDADYSTFTRSTLKPFQALPMIRDGGHARFGWTSRQVALMCASHSGEPMHTEVVAAMLASIGCGPADLQCGCHVPGFYAATGASPASGLASSPLQHNCSGKHAGFLAACRMAGDDVGGYLAPDSRLQLRVRDAVADLAGVGPSTMAAGTDGCSAPNYALPLSRLAFLYAGLAQGVAAPREGASLQVLFDAMTAHPELVSGTARSDLALMAVAPGDWVAKIGADGVQAIGIRSRGIGIAIKIADGSRDALFAVVVETLRQLGLLDREVPLPESFGPWYRSAVRSARGRVTGAHRPVFELKAAP